MMTAPDLIFGRWGGFFWMWFQQNPFLSHFLVQFFFCRWIGFDLQNMDFVGNYPTEEKVNNAKVQIYQPLSSCFDSNSTFHDTAMCVGHLYNGTMENRFAKKWFRLRTGWLTTSRNSTERGQTWWACSEMTEWQYFVSYTFVKSYFSRANFSDGSHAPVCRTLWKTSEPKFKDSVKWTISSGRLGQLFR